MMTKVSTEQGSAETALASATEELGQLRTRLTAAKTSLEEPATERQALLNKAVTPTEHASTDELQAWLETLSLQQEAGTTPTGVASAEGALGSQTPYGWLEETVASQAAVAAQLAQPSSDVLMEQSKNRAGEDEQEEPSPSA